MSHLRRLILPTLLALAFACEPAAIGGPPPGEGVIENPGLESATLRIIGSSRVGMTINAESELLIEYLDGDGEPVDGYVNFSIGTIDSGGASLAAENVQTNSVGVASVLLRSRGPANFTVNVMAAAADPVMYDVEVLEGQIVNLSITPVYEGMRRVGDIDVGIFTNYTCAGFADLVPTPAFLETTREDRAVEFAGVDTAIPTVAYALGYNTRGQIAVFRCQDLDLAAGLEIDLPLTDVNDLRGGVFAMTETFDVTAGFHPALNFILDMLNGLGTDPADWLIRTAAMYFDIPSSIRSLIEESATLRNRINMALNDILPESLAPWLEAGAGIDQVFREMTLVGTLTISESDEFGMGFAEHRIDDMRVMINGEPYTVAVNERATMVPVMFGSENMSIDPHSFNISFGDLVEAIITDVILPRFPGSPANFTQLIEMLVPCDAMENWVYDNFCLTGNATVDRERTGDCLGRDATGFACRKSVEYVGTHTAGWLGNLVDYDMLTLNGSGMTIDNDSDYRVDAFEGTADASWDGGPTSALEFTGELNGTREGDPVNRQVDRVKEKFDMTVR